MLRILRDLFKPEKRPKPESPDELFQQARALQEKGELAPAAEVLRLILESHPDHRNALDALAAIALQGGELEEAVRLYGTVIDEMPNSAEPYYKRANAA